MGFLNLGIVFDKVIEITKGILGEDVIQIIGNEQLLTNDKYIQISHFL